MESIFVPDPVVSLSIEPKGKGTKDYEIMIKALTRFSKEDPTFVVKYDEETDQRTISGMGELHLEIYAQRMEREYGCPVQLGRPKVLFYETLLESSSYEYLHRRQTGGRGQYGKASGFVRPTFDAEKNDLRVAFKDATEGNDLSKHFVPSIERGMRSVLNKGPLANKPVVGFHIELESGKEHQSDSSDFAFFNCGAGCMEQVFQSVSTKILGPVMKVEVTTPNQFQNNVVHTISNRHGTIIEHEETMEYTTYQAHVQLYDMFGFTADLRQCSEGKAEYSMEFYRYDYARDEIEDILEKEKQEELQALASQEKGKKGRLGKKKKG